MRASRSCQSTATPLVFRFRKTRIASLRSVNKIANRVTSAGGQRQAAIAPVRPAGGARHPTTRHCKSLESTHLLGGHQAPINDGLDINRIGVSCQEGQDFCRVRRQLGFGLFDFPLPEQT
jgi:hypothetical protein